MPDLSGGTTRKFPAPWRVEDIAGGCVVVDANSFRLAYVYSREEEVMRTDHLSPAEARKIALLIAQLPENWKQKRA